jgi:hypothetical protein
VVVEVDGVVDGVEVGEVVLETEVEAGCGGSSEGSVVGEVVVGEAATRFSSGGVARVIEEGSGSAEHPAISSAAANQTAFLPVVLNM